MARIAVFDSGLGSLSIIKSIQKFTKSEIIYFADQKNFPYGTKSKAELKKIIDKTILKLEKIFEPDIIVMASNTPSILFPDYLTGKIIGVLPPIKQAAMLTETGNIGILATTSAVKSTSLSRYVKKSSSMRVRKIDVTELIRLVETGKFLREKKYCTKIIRKILGRELTENNIDVVTLSSTHLPFLLPILKKEFPSIKFLDPADEVGKKIAGKIKNSKQNKLKIYTSNHPEILQSQLRMIGIKNKVSFLP